MRTSVRIGADEGFELAKATLWVNGHHLSPLIEKESGSCPDCLFQFHSVPWWFAGCNAQRIDAPATAGGSSDGSANDRGHQ
jgi:hypothetical protein